MRFSTIARSAMTGSGAALLAASAVAAQQPAAPAPAPIRTLSLSREERVALQALEAAARSIDRAAQDAALAAARAAARSDEARYGVAHFQLQIGQARADAQLINQAVDAIVSSGHAQAAELPALIVNQAARAYQEGELQRADRLLARVIELQPNSPAILADRAQVRARMAGALRMGGREPEALAAYQDAVTLLQRAIQLQRAAGQAAPESWYQRAIALAVEGRLAAPGIASARELVGAYPTPLNWRDALLVYKGSVPPDPALDLDVRRLMRAAQALSGERDYLELAEALGQVPLPGEVKDVIDEGVARGMLDANEPIVRQLTTANNRRLTADRNGLARLRTQALAAATGAQARAAGDSHFGYGRYAEAAELYRAALQKGGEDTNLVNTRLGAALALAGQRAEAEAAFRSVTGPRADLAAFWLAWLARRPA